MNVVLFSIGVLLILGTLLPFWRTDRWWVRAFDFPRLQIAIVIALTVAVLAVRSERGGPAELALLLLGLLLALGYQLFRIRPYTPLAAWQTLPAERRVPGTGVRLMIANVLMSNRDSERFLRIVAAASPDLLLALETDDWWDRQLVALDKDYPFAVKRPLDNTYGLHLFSRFELVEPKLRYLVEPGIPSVETGLRLPSGTVIGFYGVHPQPPRPAQDTGERDAELLIVGRKAKTDRRPVIVAGDLNDVAWSHTTRLFQRISGLLDPRVGRGLYSTFHAKIPFLRWPLDHVFHDATFRLGELRRLGGFGSDHFPILVELYYEPAAREAQEPPTPAPGDRIEATKKIDAGTTEG